MLRFVKRRAFLLVLAFLLVAIFIWFAGPYFAFADRAPLETARARVIAIALVVALWGAWVLIKRLRAGRASDKLAAAVLKQAPGDEALPSAEAVKLRERFEEAVATLKQHRRAGHSLYDLPWYVFIGAPGSGKTTALLNSGLRFPLEQRVGKGALRGVGGTRNCDWWFTDEAVFLDTAGRYLTQDSDAASDRAGWEEFLTLLRKYRRRRPLNGIILTISTEDLLKQGAAGREAYAEAARRRLTELNRELRVRLPVYLMVTKCDLVAGFSEYFDDLAQDGRAQVWGVTFPYEQTREGRALQTFPSEFEALIARLNHRLLDRLEDERDPRRRSNIFGFPQQMAALRDLLVSFIGEVFASTRFEQQILVRGVYFTSGTQDGTQIDRLLGTIGRRFGLAPEVVAPPAGRGKAYFIERLLKQVVIGESGLAGVDRRFEVQKAALQLAAYAAMALVVVAGVVLLSISYGRNRDYLRQVAAEIETLRGVPAAAPGAPVEAFLPRLDAVRAVVVSADRYRDDVPLAMRWGLYQGNSVGKSARDAYVRELDGVLLPNLAARIRQRLVEHAAEPETLYIYLKAYLMLGEPKHLDKTHLQYLADLEWNASGRGGGAAGASMSNHFKSLLEYGETLRPIPVDASLVAQARTTIQRASIPRIMYNRLKQAYADDVARAVRLDVAGGAGVEQVFRRRSGVPLSEPVPSLYGRAVFKEVTTTGTALLVKQFAEDDWVWGAEGVSLDNPLKLAAAVTGIYEDDYIATWDAVLHDLELVPLSTVAQLTDGLGILSGPASPLRGLLSAVVENTSLVEDPAAEESPGAQSSATQSIKDRLGRILKPVESLGDALGPWPGALVTAHFQPVHRLLAGVPGSAPLDAILARMGEVHAQLEALGPEVGGTTPLDALSSPVLRDLLASLRQEAGTLPPSVSPLVTQLADTVADRVASGATSDLETRYDREVVQPCAEVLAGRYPLAAGSERDVPLADFGRVLGYGGLFDAFFRDNLAPLVDTSRSPWSWRPGSVRASRAMLAQFEAAQRLREVFFTPGSQAPSVRFTVTLSDLDASSTRFVLEIDGQRFDVRRGPGRTVSAAWPARSPGEAVATFEDRFGAWPTLRFTGPWAMFRLMDATRARPEGELSVALSFENSGRRAKATVEAASLRNPFTNRDWRHFRCEF